MPLTRDFRVTIHERLKSDPGFREALLEEGVQCLLASLRDHQLPSGTGGTAPQSTSGTMTGIPG